VHALPIEIDPPSPAATAVELDALALDVEAVAVALDVAPDVEAPEAMAADPVDPPPVFAASAEGAWFAPLQAAAVVARARSGAQTRMGVMVVMIRPPPRGRLPHGGRVLHPTHPQG